MSLTIDKNAGWQEIEVHPRSRRPEGWGWLAAGLVWFARAVVLVVTVVVTFVGFNWLPVAAVVPAVWTWAVAWT